MFRFLLSTAVLIGLSGAAQAQLVIAGGGLKSETEDVWKAFIDQAHMDGDFVIVPSASGRPAQSAASVRATLIGYGVDPDRISVAPLAVRDDDATPDVDEAEWEKNIDDPETVRQLQDAAAIWFTGGDQSRTTGLLRPDDEDTPVLRAIREALAGGAPVGGTSAGAAIMSSVMIRQGDSLTALTGSAEGEALSLGKGLGFLPRGLVDQHFGERARLGRLAAALVERISVQDRIGFGIDENTALVVLPDGTATVSGTGYVTVLDARSAKLRQTGGRLQISGLLLHMASAGDRIDLDSLALTPADWKKPTVGEEYVRTAVLGGGGMALQGQTLQSVVGDGLIDNAQSETIERISFDNTGRGVGYVFTQSRKSSGFWGRGPEGRGGYTIANIRYDIVPLDLTMKTLTFETP